VHSYAIFRQDKSYLFDIQADSEKEAIERAILISVQAKYARLIVPGNDFGCDGM